MLKTIFFSLFTHISVGLIFTILFISKEEIGKLYFRVTTFVAFVLIFTALLAKPFGEFQILQIVGLTGTKQNSLEQITYLLLILSVILIILYNLYLPRLHRTTLSIIFLLGIIAISNHALMVSDSNDYGTLKKAMVITNAISSSVVSGSVVSAMITGHWYLVKHNLSLNPLRNASLIYIISVLFRIIIIILTFLTFWQMEQTHALANKIFGLTVEGIFFIGRVVIGLIIPLIFGFMIWGTVKIRSTQSATGILYATIILVLMGEVFAKYISKSIGIPL